MSDAVQDQDLAPVLMAGDPDDLAVLVDYITDSGTGRLAVSTKTRLALVKAKDTRNFQVTDRELISKEISEFGANSIIALFRRKGVSYAEIVRDVADRAGAKYEDGATVVEVEQALLAVFAEKALKEMNAKDRGEWMSTLEIPTGAGPAALASLLALIRLGGFQSYQIALLVANAAARALLGRGLAFGANAVLTKGLSLVLGPVGLVITGLWTAFDIASPAYRVTVPCVIQVAYMRQRSLHAPETSAE